MLIIDWSSDVCSSDLETCGFHAEAFSAAEVRHGPMALVGKGFPVLLLAQEDATRDRVAALAHAFAARGATLLHAGLGDAAGIALPVQVGQGTGRARGCQYVLCQVVAV